jgi:hypothetical protein
MSYAEPRFTNDIDVVANVSPRPSKAPARG